MTPITLTLLTTAPTPVSARAVAPDATVARQPTVTGRVFNAPALSSRQGSMTARLLRAILSPIRIVLLVVWSVLFVFAQAVQGLGLIALFIAARIRFDPPSAVRSVRSQE